MCIGESQYNAQIIKWGLNKWSNQELLKYFLDKETIIIFEKLMGQRKVGLIRKNLSSDWIFISEESKQVLH